MSRPPLPAPPTWHSKILSVGVTGTNGKTSTTRFVAAALSTIQTPVARFTTVGSYLGDAPIDQKFTHPVFLETLQRMLRLGGRYAAIEVTSEALATGYSKIWPCQIAAFTNLTRDHFDAHQEAEHYLASKAQLFMDLPSNGTAVLNACDEASCMLEEVIPPGVKVLRYGLAERGEPYAPPHLRASCVHVSWDGTRMDLEADASLAELPKTWSIRAVGHVFVENALAALLASVAAGAAPSQAARAIASAEPPPGRFQVIATHPHVVVDYAHTPDALARTLAAARSLCRGRLVVVFGAGGNRDKGKRPLMGTAASSADRVLLTNDNPRSEPPMAIVDAIRAGLVGHPCVDVELDRARAIQRAVCDASPNDVVVIAGKGHETHQVIDGSERDFSDVDLAQRAHQDR